MLKALMGLCLCALFASAGSFPIDGSDPEVFYLFLRTHVRLVALLGPPLAGNPYGIPDSDFNRIASAASPLLDRLTAQDKTARQSLQRGEDVSGYTAARRKLLDTARDRVRAAVSAPAWPAIERYLNYTVDSGMIRAIPNRTVAGKNRTTNYLCGSNVVYVEDTLYFYNGGLAGISDTGLNAVSNCIVSVTQAKTSFNGVAYAHPTDAVVQGGREAWTESVSLNPPPGTFREESFHSIYDPVSGQMEPPFPSFVQPAAPGYFFILSNGYSSFTTTLGVSLTANAPQEYGKTNHYLALTGTCSAPVTVTLNVNFKPGPYEGIGAPPVKWTGGLPGNDNLHRLVDCTTAGTATVSASIGRNLVATATIHSVDATPPPPSTPANLSWTFGGVPSQPEFGGDCTQNAFVCTSGLTELQIGTDGIVAPTYSALPYFATDRWVFRLASVNHVYKEGENPVIDQLDLETGNPQPFPIASCCTTASSARYQARSDLDTSNLVPNANGIVRGPNANYYYVRSSVVAHEGAHVAQFYGSSFPYWSPAMLAFQTQYVENSATVVVYDCANPATTTGTGASGIEKSDWDTAVANLHKGAFTGYCAWDGMQCVQAETYAYGISNPLVAKVWSQIPVEGSPTINGISPAVLTAGTSGFLYIYGQNLDASPTVIFSGGGIAGYDEYVSPTQINFYYTVAAGLPPGNGSVSVLTNWGKSAPANLTIVSAPPPTPTVALFVSGPQSGTSYRAGDSFNLTVTGAGYSGQPVAVAQNGAAPVILGYIAGSSWSVSGTWTQANIGNYTQTWYVGGIAATPSLSFSVTQ